MRQEIERYLHYLATERGASAHTVAAYRNDLSQLCEFLEAATATRDRSFAGDGLDLAPRGGDRSALTRSRLVAFLVWLKEKRYAPATLARKIAAVKSFCHFLVAQGLLSEDPSENLEPPKVGKTLPRTLTPAEAERLLQQPLQRQGPEALRDAAMLRLLYATGLRVSELVALNLDDVEVLSRYVRCVGRRERERIIPFDEATAELLHRYLAQARPHLVRRRDEPALFVNHRGERLTRQGFWLILKEYARRAGLGDDITPHTLRHSFAVDLLARNSALRDVQALLGHASITTTQVYHQLVQTVRRSVGPRSVGEPLGAGSAHRE